MSGSGPLLAEAFGPAMRYLAMPAFGLLGLFFLAAGVAAFVTGKTGANVKERVVTGRTEYTGLSAYWRGFWFLVMGLGLTWFGFLSMIKGYNVIGR